MLGLKTREYYQNTGINKRKQFGQYMTPYDIIDSALNFNINQYDKILEPSCGTGQFIEKILEKLNLQSNNKITIVEIDNELYKLNTITYGNNKNITIINDDFLVRSFDSKFNLIIGNPPYFEFKPDNVTKKLYSNIINGRANIYMLFIKKCIDLLEPKGILLFVIPTSLLSSIYFLKIRKYIVDTCNIIRIDILSSDNFEDALQQTMIFKISRLLSDEKSDGKYIIKLGSNLIFNSNYYKLNNLLQDKKYIKDYNCYVKTGSIIWNQHKNNLYDNPTNTSNILVYPRNLTNNNIILSTHLTKKQYIEIKKEPIKCPVIVINRIIGIKEISLKPVLIKTGKYHFENHVNVIIGPLKELNIIYKSLIKPETIEFIKNIIGNTQLSKTELETMIPIFK